METTAKMRLRAVSLPEEFTMQTPKEISGCTVYTKGYAAYADGLITVGEQQYRLAQTVAGDCKGYETLIANVTVNETDDLPFTSAPGEKFMDATEAGSYRIGSIGNGTPEEIDGVCDAAYEVSFQKHNFGSVDGGKTGWSDMRADLWAGCGFSNTCICLPPFP